MSLKSSPKSSLCVDTSNLRLQVPEKDLARMAAIIKTSMETAVRLSVQLPVKLQAGPSWGTLRALDM